MKIDQNLVPKSISPSYRQRRRCRTLFPVQPIELRSNVFQQRFYRSGSLEELKVRDKYWPTTNSLQLSDEYLYKCKYAMYASKCTKLNADEFARFLKEFFSYPMTNEDENGELIRCELCSNRFHSNEMYQLHFHRRSLSIEYRCLTCQSWIQSTNPCQAYSHLSSHQSTTAIIEQLQINSNWTNSLVGVRKEVNHPQ